MRSEIYISEVLYDACFFLPISGAGALKSLPAQQASFHI
jgi:hypothetical protein